MIRFLFIAALCAGLCVNSVAQDFPYEPLRSSGTLPPILSTPLAETIRLETGKITSAGQKSKRDYIETSQFVLSSIFRSGKVLVNDTLGKYVNAVADSLLRNEPALRKELQFFILKSPDANACTFYNGVIFVNTGLLAKIENEAQLAFIIAHEIVHYRQQHGYEQYQETVRPFVGISGNATFITLSCSRSHEIIADAEAVQLLRNGNYDTKQALRIIELLGNSDMPFAQVPFEKSYFESEDFELPESLSLKNTKVFLDAEDQLTMKVKYDDTWSTHPTIEKRKQNISTFIEDDIPSNGKRLFIATDESKFEKLRTIARFELCRLQMVNFDYYNAIYTAFLLQQDYPDNIYLKKVVAKSLYNISVYKLRKFPDFPKVKEEYDDDDYDDEPKRLSLPSYLSIHGASQPLYYLFDNLSAPETALLSLSYCWKLKTQNSHDRELENICNSLLSLLIRIHKLSKEHFIKKDAGLLATKDSTTASYILQFKVIGSLLGKDTLFASKFNSIGHRGQEDKSTHLSAKDTVMIINPLYCHNSVKGTKNWQYNSELSKRDLELYYSLLFPKISSAGLSYKLLSFDSLKNTDVDLYNEYAALAEWNSERLQHCTRLAMTTSTDGIDEFQKKYEYCLWTIGQTERVKHKNWGGYLAMSLLIPPVLPFMVIAVIHPRYQQRLSISLVNIRTEKVIAAENSKSRKPNTKKWLDKRTSAFFLQLPR